MILPGADWQRRDGMDALLAALDAPGGATRYVGGCVRDTLLGLAVNDVDLATRLQPAAVVAALENAGIKAVPTGIAHGTVTAISQGTPVEITTLRRDLATDGRRATIAFTDDWREDAARRDFTINALSADPVSGELFDYFDGLADIEQGHVRFIGDPLTRIAEDHLRILRFFRFYARFGRGEPDAAALAACRARANDLMALSRERIADELLKMLALAAPQAAVALMIGNGILKPVLPEARAEALAALIEREEKAGIPGEPLRRLAALLPADPALAAAVASRLRLSKKAAKRLASAAAREDAEIENPQLAAYRIGAAEAIDRILLGGGDLRGIQDLADWERPRLLIGGGDLIAMGMPAGPGVAAALQALEKEWAEQGFNPDAEAQNSLARRHVDQASRANQ